MYTVISLCHRWIIQKAFFYPRTTGVCSCAGISWRNLFLRFSTCCEPQIKGIKYSKALTLDDLDELTPTYIGCITSNRWTRSSSPRETDYEVLTMSPHDTERLDRPRDEEELSGKLTPMDVYLSDAAATSAAAVNHHMGRLRGGEAHFTDLKVLLGLSVGASVVSDKRHEEKRHFCLQVMNTLVNSKRNKRIVKPSSASAVCQVVQ